jgi:iron complex transport system substrate-binding protein
MILWQRRYSGLSFGLSTVLRPLRAEVGRWLLLGLLINVMLTPFALATPSFITASVPAPERAERIVSLDLCMDRMLALHADRDQVAALSPMHKRFPLPWPLEGWPGHDGSLEQVFSLRPDLILVGQHNALMLRKRLQTLNQPVELVTLPHTLAEIEAYERRVLSLIGRDPAGAHPAPEPQAPAAAAPRLLLLGANGIGTGPNTFEDQIIRQAGWRNYLNGVRYERLDLERVIADPPEAILWTSPGAQALATRFADHPALRHSIPAAGWLDTERWRWQCPGPWTWQLIDQLRQQLPEQLLGPSPESTSSSPTRTP